jgi:hypothetical protein
MLLRVIDINPQSNPPILYYTVHTPKLIHFHTLSYLSTSLPFLFSPLAHHHPHTIYLAITSIYRPPFFPFLTVPPFLACGTPIRSSILLALLTPLMPVPGLDGGANPPVGGPEPVGEVRLPILGETFLLGGPEAGGGPPIGGPLIGGESILTPKPVGLLVGGPLAALTFLLFGGGGVGVTGVVASAPAFLFTHFFRFSS